MENFDINEFIAQEADQLVRELNVLQARSEIRKLRLIHVRSCISYIQVMITYLIT